MDEQHSLEQDVQALRLAAEQGDWNACRNATEKLLVRLPTIHAVRFVRDFVLCRLPVFERQHPGVSWPRGLLELVGEEEPIGRDKTWPGEDEFSGPGANSFAKAVESLWNAWLRTEDARQCIPELVSAISRAIMAERVEYWGARHSQKWALWYQLALNGDSDPRITEILTAMASDPDVKRLQRKAWQEVADKLAGTLHGVE
jgi:hypothetical protein